VGASSGVLRLVALVERAAQMGVRAAFARARTTLRRHGFGAAAQLTWATVDRRVRGAKRVLLFGLAQPLPMAEAEAAARCHVFRWATVEDLTVAQTDGTGLWLPQDLAAAERGDRCLLQLDGGRLVGYTWVSCHPITFVTEGLHINLPDDTAYVYRAYTAPAYRGGGFQGLRTQELLRRVRPEGKQRLLCYVEDTNFESLKGVRKSGYQPIGEILFTREQGQVRVSLRLAQAYWSEQRRMM
jgi:ribosomal protein S18 acetylase RimI-like enzyme